MKTWGNVASGLLVFNQKYCSVLLQCRSNEVLQPDTWNLIGGAVSDGFDDDHQEIFSNSNVSERKIKASALDEFREETNYDGRIDHVTKYHIFPDETPKSNIQHFKYHSYAAFIPEPIYPPTLYDDDQYWEAESYMWVDLETLFQVAEDQKNGDFKRFRKVFNTGGNGLHPAFAETITLPVVQDRLRKIHAACQKHID